MKTWSWFSCYQGTLYNTWTDTYFMRFFLHIRANIQGLSSFGLTNGRWNDILTETTFPQDEVFKRQVVRSIRRGNTTLSVCAWSDNSPIAGIWYWCTASEYGTTSIWFRRWRLTGRFTSVHWWLPGIAAQSAGRPCIPIHAAVSAGWSSVVIKMVAHRLLTSQKLIICLLILQKMPSEQRCNLGVIENTGIGCGLHNWSPNYENNHSQF